MKSKSRHKNVTAYLNKKYAKAIKTIKTHDISGWYDLWHTHIDWNSRGNHFLSTRVLVARMTYELLLAAERHFSQRQEPIQLFALISDEDTGKNSVYAHTPNPNGTPYPCELKVKWGVKPPVEIADVIDQTRYEVGKGKGEVTHFIRPRA